MAKSAKTTVTLPAIKRGKLVSITLTAAVLATLDTLRAYFNVKTDAGRKNANRHLPAIGVHPKGHPVYNFTKVETGDGRKVTISRLGGHPRLETGFVIVKEFKDIAKKMAASADPQQQLEFVKVWNSAETRAEVNAHYAEFGAGWVSDQANRIRRRFKDAGRTDCPLQVFDGVGVGGGKGPIAMDLDALAGVKKTVDKPAKKPAKKPARKK